MFSHRSSDAPKRSMNNVLWFVSSSFFMVSPVQSVWVVLDGIPRQMLSVGRFIVRGQALFFSSCAFVVCVEKSSERIASENIGIFFM